MANDDEKIKVRHELLVAIAGILVGVLGTFFTKVAESEYQYWRDLKMVEFKEDCAPAPSGREGQFRLGCTFVLSAKGKGEISDVRLSVAGGRDNIEVKTASLESSPYFAPPDPPPQMESWEGNRGSQAIAISRFREPQRVTWRVEFASAEPISGGLNDIQRVVSTTDKEARIDAARGLRITRAITVILLGAGIPLVIILMIVVVWWMLRPKKETKRILWE
jgi:hypothetical protein